MIILDIIISREEIKEYEKLKIISELSLVKQRVKLFEIKYKCSFDEFETQLSQKREEDFKQWDDYIEWKAYTEKQETLKEKLEQIANAQDIKIVEDT